MTDDSAFILDQKRQQGGIGSAAHDPAQTDIRAFFGGASAKSGDSNQPNKASGNVHVGLEEGRAVSNVFDEAGEAAVKAASEEGRAVSNAFDETVDEAKL